MAKVLNRLPDWRLGALDQGKCPVSAVGQFWRPIPSGRLLGDPVSKKPVRGINAITNRMMWRKRLRSSSALEAGSETDVTAKISVINLDTFTLRPVGNRWQILQQKCAFMGTDRETNQ